MLDIIPEHNLIELYNSPKMSILISQIWQGKYESHSFLNYSLNYQIIKSILLKQVRNLFRYTRILPEI